MELGAIRLALFDMLALFGCLQPPYPVWIESDGDVAGIYTQCRRAVTEAESERTGGAK